MQAIILAAGMGKRLGELTHDNTKCMIKVNGQTLIERMLSQLDSRNLSRIILVVGYEGKKLVDYVQTLPIRTPLVFVENDIYYKTNNIYSLYLAKDYLVEQDTILLESDLIFEDAVISKILDDPYPSLALVAKFESWMDGTVVTLNEDHRIKRFITTEQFEFEEIPSYYKTVNIYKFSKEFSYNHYIPFLEAYSRALGNNEYYEQVLRVITLLDKAELKALPLDDEAWYEIDDIQDLDIAESIFAPDSLSRIASRYGGYWRYPHILDFCYLVNPYFPNPRLLAEIKANFERLIVQYPSGLRINNLLAAKNFGLRLPYVVVGNGATELIKSLMERLPGKLGNVLPTFEEYPNRRKREDVCTYIPNNANFAYSADDLITFFSTKKITTLLLINPDNPSGNFIPKSDVLRLCEWSHSQNIRFILDESFVDFSEEMYENTLLDNTILEKYPNLIVVKSISKSYGVPGLRLGFVASADTELIKEIGKDISIWNINSFAEFYMQIFSKYEKEYKAGCSQFIAERERFYRELSKIPFLRVIPSQANYFLCEVTSRFTSCQLTAYLLQHNILIKDCVNKHGFDGRSFIRIAIKSKDDNNYLISILQQA